MQQLRSVTGAFVPTQPRHGCTWAARGERGHALAWAGWWQSGNPEVAMPRWQCTCGRFTTDLIRARWLLGRTLGPAVHGRGGQVTERPAPWP